MLVDREKKFFSNEERYTVEMFDKINLQTEDVLINNAHIN